MSAPKTLARWGVLANLEASYGAGGSLSNSTDGVAVVERPDVDIQWGFDGKRPGKAPGTPGMIEQVAPSAQSGAIALTCEPTGPTLAYTNTFTQAPNVHRLLRMAGLDAAFSGGVGNEQIAYTPTPDGASAYASGLIRAFLRGQQHDLVGVYGEGFTLSAKLGEVPTLVVPVKGIMTADPTDLALPTIAYPNKLPPKATQIALSLGGHQPTRVREFTLEFKRNIVERAFDVSGDRHGGFTPGVEREFTLSVIVEAAALASFNPYAVRRNATKLALSFNIGGVQYNRSTIAAANAQLMDHDDGDDNGVATWELTFGLKTSTPTASDEMSWTWT